MTTTAKSLLLLLSLSLFTQLSAQLPYADEFTNGDFSGGIGDDLMPVEWYIQKDSSDNVLAGTQIVLNEGETPVDGSSSYVSLVKDQEAMKIALASPAIPEPGYGAVEVTFYAKSAEAVQLNLNLLPEPWPAKLNYSTSGFNLTPSWELYTAVHALPFGNHPDMRWFLDYIHDTDLGTADITGIEVRYLDTYPSDKLENGDFIGGTTVGGLPVNWFIQEATTEDVLFGDHIYVSNGDTPDSNVLNFLSIEPPSETSVVEIASTAFPMPEGDSIDLEFQARSTGAGQVQVSIYELLSGGKVLLDQEAVTIGADWTENQFSPALTDASGPDARLFITFSVTGQIDPVDIANVKVLQQQQQGGSDVANPVIDPVLQRDWDQIDEKSFNKYWALRTAMPDLSEEVPQASDFTTVYYIDPDAGQSGDGLSPESPLNSWTEVTFTSGTAYLQKCGTSEVLSQRLITENNVLLGAYGEGPRPVIEVTEHLSNDNAAIHAASNITVRDLDIKAPNLAACIKLGSNSNITVYNNVLHDSIWGIRGYSTNYKIYGNIIHNHQDDGIYLKNAGDLDIGWNYIFHINTDWVPPYTSQDEASGDSIQFDTCINWNVHHNVLDRTSSGNKFAFISNDGSGNCIVEYNYMAGPLSDGDGGAAIYFGGAQTTVEIRYNHLDRAVSGIYSHAPLHIHGNIISNSNSGIYGATISNTIHHNVLYNINGYLIRNGGEVTNNILDNGKGKVNLVQNITTLQYNLFMGAKTGDDSNFSADPGFIDPERDNFRLTSGSPAIDAGITGVLTEDRDGFAIPQGAGPDIGAHEYHGGINDPWTVIYREWTNGWKLTPHGYAYDGSFPWILRLPVVGDNAGISQWFYILESSITEDGFYAYDDQRHSWILVSLPVSPWVYLYSNNPDWIIWD